MPLCHWGLQPNVMPNNLDFEQVYFTCGVCHNRGCVQAVWVALTEVGLRGYCPRCRLESVRILDLLRLEDWRAGDNSPFKEPADAGRLPFKMEVRCGSCTNGTLIELHPEDQHPLDAGGSDELYRDIGGRCGHERRT